MCDCQKKLVNIEDLVLEGIRRIKEEQEGSEFITLHGKEGEIIYDVCQLIASKDGDHRFLKYAGYMLFEDVPVICR